MKKIMCLLLVLMLSLVVLTACGTNTATNESQQEEEISWEDMERIEVFLPDLEDELKKDSKDGNWLAFYERYKDKVLVFKDASVSANYLDSPHMNYLLILHGGDGRGGFLHCYFDEEDKTDELLGFSNENISLEGILKQPEKTYAKPLNLAIEHTKVIEHSPWENPLYLPIDMEPVFEETKTELLSKYSFVKNIEFSVRRTGEEGSVLSSDDIEFVTDVEPGTDAKEVLAYADYAVRLLNENARKVDDTIAPSTGDSYGGLYRNNYISVLVRPEGVVEARNKYYIFDSISARVGATIKLQKAYR